MDKLLLTLTLLAFSSGVLCDVPQNLTEGGPAADETQLTNAVCKVASVCTAGDVRDDYVVFRGVGSYKVHKQPLATWNEAREICMNEGAVLPIINSNAEAQMLVDWLSREKVNVAWIGTHDLFQQSHWVTLTGETLAAAGYDKWSPGEPNNAFGTEHCGTLQYPGGMNDLTCSQKMPYFCKMNIW